LPEDDKTFDPKMASIKEFMKATKTWIAAVHEGSLQKDDAEADPQDSVKPSDSISQCGACYAGHDHQNESHVSRKTTTSRASSTCVKQEAEHAALLERAAAQKKKQQLEFETQQLEFEMAKLKGAKEVLKEYKRSEDGSGSRGYSSHALVKLLRGGNGKQEVSSRESINSLPQPVNPGFHAQPQMLQSQVPKWLNKIKVMLNPTEETRC
jgi:hypothetical protein